MKLQRILSASAFSIFLFFGATKAYSSLSNIEQYNVIWNTPGTGALNSMPLGNGSTAINVWTEENGDLLFYISRIDALNKEHEIIKLGRVRVSFDNKPFAKGLPYKQTLDLANAQVLIDGGLQGHGIHLRIWVDANRSVVRVQGMSETPVSITATYELQWRKPISVKTLTEPAAYGDDIILDNNEVPLVWYHRNIGETSWMSLLKRQVDSVDVPRLARLNPIVNNTFGGALTGNGMNRWDAFTLKSIKPTTEISLEAHILANQYTTIEEWKRDLDTQQLATNAVDPKTAWIAHQQWWTNFWNRSWIHVTGCDEVPNMSQDYAVQRFITACAGRGKYTIPFNGSIFNVDVPEGAFCYLSKLIGKGHNADWRAWGSKVMWQNVRHIYWPMLANGDMDLMPPAFDVIEKAQEVAGARTKFWYKHAGAIMTESLLFGGVTPHPQRPAHLSRHYSGSAEMLNMGIQLFEQTGDTAFLRKTLLPLADLYVQFFSEHFPMANGKTTLYPSGVVESFGDVTNSITDLSGLIDNLDRLIKLPDNYVTTTQKQRWKELRASLAPIPTRRFGGVTVVADAEYMDERRIYNPTENPPLYAIFPFNCITDWKNNVDLGRQTFYSRLFPITGSTYVVRNETGGWNASPVQAAYLGLPEESGYLITRNFVDDMPMATTGNYYIDVPRTNPGHNRLQAFWRSHYDWTPDQCHGGATMNALQKMMLQTDGDKIFLLPSWPENWNVSFKLHTSQKTVVECTYRNGNIEKLEVTPASRKADVVNCITSKKRIQTIVQVAGMDRSAIFSTSPLRDGSLVTKSNNRPITGAWLKKYAESVAETSGGPFESGTWGTSTYKGNYIYLHILNSDNKILSLPALEKRKILKATVLTGGKVSFKQSGEIITLSTSKQDSINTIVRLELDGAAADEALLQPSRKSLTKKRIASSQNVKLASNLFDGDPRTTWTLPDTSAKTEIWVEVNFGKPTEIERVEVRAMLPPFKGRTVGKPLEVEVFDDSKEKWTKIASGNIYGPLWCQSFKPIKCMRIRLVSHTPEISQFDVFAPGE